MSDIRDYLDWRGDISFENNPFNELDALALSQFVYLQFNDIVSDNMDKGCVLRKASAKYFKKHEGEENSLTLLLLNCDSIARKMMDCVRFKDIMLYKFRERYDQINAIQFAAISAKISDDCLVVSFRGTDDTLAGWEEDFRLCYMTPMDAQKEAAKYLKEVCETWDGKIIITGHSKGGNIGIYATMSLPDEYKDKVQCIYSFDGPGFLPHIVESDEYKKTIGKVISYMPQSSVVGMIMYNLGEIKVVRSNGKGFMQHAVVTWQVLGKDFVYENKFDNGSIIFNECTKKWIDEIEPGKIEDFLTTVFHILKSGNMETFTEMSSGIPQAVNNIVRTYADMDKGAKKMMRDILKEMFKISTDIIKNNKNK